MAHHGLHYTKPYVLVAHLDRKMKQPHWIRINLIFQDQILPKGRAPAMLCWCSSWSTALPSLLIWILPSSRMIGTIFFQKKIQIYNCKRMMATCWRRPSDIITHSHLIPSSGHTVDRESSFSVGDFCFAVFKQISLSLLWLSMDRPFWARVHRKVRTIIIEINWEIVLQVDLSVSESCR